MNITEYLKKTHTFCAIFTNLRVWDIFHSLYLLEEVFKKAEISEGVNVDRENLSNLRFADDIALLNETTKQMEKHVNNLNSESMKVGLKIHKGKTKYMTNYADSEDILIGQ